jgi:hypothetical protein
MRRRAAGHEPHFFEPDRLGEFLRQSQMAKVYGVESAAENGDGLDRHASIDPVGRAAHEIRG